MARLNANLLICLAVQLLLLSSAPHLSAAAQPSASASASTSTLTWTYSIPENTAHPHVVANISTDYLRTVASSRSSSSSQPPTFELVPLRAGGGGGGNWFELATLAVPSATGAGAGATTTVLRVAPNAAIDREDPEVCAPRGGSASSSSSPAHCVVRLLLSVRVLCPILLLSAQVLICLLEKSSSIKTHNDSCIDNVSSIDAAQ